MKQKLTMPTASTLMMLVTIMAALCTWILPAGEYGKLTNDNNKQFIVTANSGTVALPFTQHTLDSLSIHIDLAKFSSGSIAKPISVPGTYQRLPRKPQGFIDVLQAPIKGIMDSIDIVLFILIIGGFMQVFNGTEAMLKGVSYLAFRMKGREQTLILVLTIIFSFLGSSYGMDVEAIVFYPVLVPLFVAAGYNRMVPLAIVFGGAAIGYISSFCNPFSTIIASNSIGINWIDGLYERLLYFFISTGLYSVYLLRYAKKHRINTTELAIESTQQDTRGLGTAAVHHVLTGKTVLLLLLFLVTFTSMITGIIFFGWWCVEMSALFLGAAILVAIIAKMKEQLFVQEFTKGMESLLIVAVIVGLARGVTIVLNNGLVSDSILYYASGLVHGVSPMLFIALTMLFYFFFAIPVSSSSGMAVLTMPIIGALAILLNIPGREVVNAYLFGMASMFLISPTAAVFPALTMVNVEYKDWLKFILPFLIGLLVASAGWLMLGIHFK